MPKPLASRRAFRAGFLATIALTLLFVRADVAALDDFLKIVNLAPVDLTERYLHSATLLQDGKVLITGGVSNTGYLSSAYLFDPDFNSFTATGNDILRRGYQTSTLLPNGNVLVAGGLDDTGILRTTSIYQPATGTFVPGPNLPTDVAFHTATPLGNGDVLFAGGFSNVGTTGQGAVYHADTNTFTLTANPLSEPRYLHVAVPLPGGRVVIHGGFGDSGLMASTEIYDPATSMFTTVAPSSLARGFHAAVYTNGRVIVAGGATFVGSVASVEAYDPATNSWTPAASLSVERQGFTATDIGNGKILFAGGLGNSGYLTSTEIYNANTNTMTPTNSLWSERYYHTATRLNTGNVLVTGGFGNIGPLSGGELYVLSERTPTAMAASVVANVGAYGRTVDVAARLTTSGIGIEGKTVRFNLGGIDLGTAITDADGWVRKTAQLDSSLIVDTLKLRYLTASFQDDGNYFGVVGSAPFRVTTKATPTITIGNTGPFPYDGQPHFASAPVTGLFGESLGSASIGYRREPSGAPVPEPVEVGTYTVTATFVTNTNYLAATKTATLTIQEADTVAPVITANDITAEATAPAGAAVTLVYSATDDVDPNPSVSADHTSGTFPLGDTSVLVTATDATGNSSQKTLVVHVVDTTNPTITAPPNQTVEATSDAGATVDPGTATGSDIAGTVVISGGGVTGTYPLGTTTLTWIATDQAGHTASGEQNITVVDTTNPTITAPANQTVEATSAAGATVDPGTATGSDAAGSVVISGGGAPGTYPLGTTTLTWIATDEAGHTATALQQITVVDTTQPTLSLPGNMTVNASSSSGAVVTFTATATDAVSGAVAVLCTPPSGSTFAIQQTTVNCSATDSSNNGSSGTFTVTVTSTEVTTPGQMRGDGHINQDGARYSFDFVVRESARGERGSFELRVDETRHCDCRDNRGRKVKHGDRDDRNHDCRGNDRDDRFKARTIDAVAFTDDPTFRPGRRARPQVDTVVFSGTGTWNGRGGYRFEARATDQGEPGRHREMLTVTVWDSNGNVVAAVDGDLDGGNIQSRRLDHGRATRW
jgi:hypothetical protein